MEKVYYEELEEVKSANEKLRINYKRKTERLENLKKLQTEQSVEIREAKSVIEKQGIEIEAKRGEISELTRINEDLQRRLSEKDSVIKRLNEANEKLRANGEDKYREYEEERRMLVSGLDEANEKNIGMEQRNNVYRAEIEGLKEHLAATERKKIEISSKDSKELRGRRDDVMMKMEEEKSRVEEKLKWKKEQFKHLEEAYEKLGNEFKANKKENEEERSSLLGEIYNLQTKLDSQTRISEDLEKKLKMCNGVLSQEETRRKQLEIEVSEFKDRYEDAFKEYRDARRQLDDLASRRDEEVADLRQSLSTKETYFKEMKYEKGKLEQENQELLASLKELQEAMIQGSGNSAISKLKNKFRKLENIHKNCSANLRSKEAEWSARMEKIAEEISGYKSKIESKEAAVKELEIELENRRISTDKLILEYEEISVMFLVLSRTVFEAKSRIENVKGEQIKDETEEERSYSLLVKQLEQKNLVLAKAHENIEAERERVTSLVKRVETLEHFEERNLQMQKEVERYKETLEESSRLLTKTKEKMKEAENDYEEKLIQVCDALDNTNSDLFTEREKVSALTREIESFSVVKEKNLVMEKEIQQYKELLEESEKCRGVLEAKISQLKSDSKENIRELCSKVDIAYAKLAEEVKKTESIDLNEEHRQKELDHYKELLEESTKRQVLLQEKVVEMEKDSKRKLDDVFEALETANCELSDKTSEVYQLEFQLWVWKSIAKRLKAELEQSQKLRKRVEASLLEQVGVEEALRQERNELKRISIENSKKAAMSDSEKDKILTQVYEESLRRELEDALFAHITAEKEWEKLAASKILTEVETEARILMIEELEGEILTLSKKLEASDESVSCLREVTLQMQEKLRDSEAEVSSLSSDKRNLMRFIGEMENRMSKICDEDMKMMKSLEKSMQHCDGFGKENNNNVDDDSLRLIMKHEDVVAIEDRSPFRQLNH